MSFLEDNGYLIFDGVKSSDYGVWINGRETFNAPARRYKEYAIPGRNGVLTIDEGAFEEQEVTYPAFIVDNFSANVQAFRNALMARNGYVRLTDSYHPDEFYLAKYMSGLEADVTPWGRAGKFDLTFKRDPRRFLLSGETPVAFSSGGSITNPTLFSSKPIIKVVPGSANLVPHLFYDDTTTVYGVTYTDDENGTVTANGTATRYSWYSVLSRTHGVTLPAGVYVARGGAAGGVINIMRWNGSANIIFATVTGTEEITFEITQEYENAPISIEIAIESGTTVNNVAFTPYIGLASDTKELAIGDTVITFGAISPYVIINSEVEDCYCGTNNLNSQVFFNNREFPVLKPGVNGITVSGVTVEITPNWYIV